MKKLVLAGLSACIVSGALAQGDRDPGQIHGNVSFIGQQYNPDPLINAVVPDPETAMNAFTNIIYSRGHFRAGVRYESYLNRLAGYPQEFDGSGIGYRFAEFSNEELTVTVGNFYDQFGSGLIFRSYQQPTLGIDGAMDGIRVKVKPHEGVFIKGLYGKMRTGFTDGLNNSDGLIRGIDGEVSLNDAFKKMSDLDHRFTLGGSFVSKYQQDDDPDLVLPENVGAWATRLKYTYKGFGFNSEYAFKINDPSFDNGYIYKYGNALLVNTSYSTKGFGIVLDYKFNDNMSYRVNRDAKLTNALIGYTPSLTRPHTYNLAATLYPYAVQLNGEVAFQGNVSYKIKRGSKLGGKYGTTISLNYAAAYGLDSTQDHGRSNPLYGYKTKWFAPGENLYFRDINLEIKRKISKRFKASLMYINFDYDNDIMQSARNNNGDEVHGHISSHIGILELSYRPYARVKRDTGAVDVQNIKRKLGKNNFRAEFQVMFIDSAKYNYQFHQGHWATIVLEYTRSPHWFVAVMDQYNFGNPEQPYKIHYLLSSIGYIHGANRIVLSYGKQREGLFCVGGICRTVPASNGFTLTVSTSF